MTRSDFLYDRMTQQVGKFFGTVIVFRLEMRLGAGRTERTVCRHCDVASSAELSKTLLLMIRVQLDLRRKKTIFIFYYLRRGAEQYFRMNLKISARE